MRIAAIIPLYNGAAFIGAALESVLAQTTPPDEIIVVDDGSTDDGHAIVAGLLKEHPTMRMVRKANGGQSSARNLGASLANGELLALLDQDDVWKPQHLERLAREFARPDADRLGWAYSDVTESDLSGTIVRARMLGHMPGSHPKPDLQAFIGRNMNILPSASLISRAAFMDVGGFDERLIGYEDDDLFLRLALRGYRHTYVDEPLSAWRVYSTSTSRSPRMVHSRGIFVHKLLFEIAELSDDNRRTVAARFAPSFLMDLVRAAEAQSPQDFQRAQTHLDELAPFLEPSLNTAMFRGVRSLMLSYPLVSTLTKLRFGVLARALADARRSLPRRDR